MSDKKPAAGSSHITNFLKNIIIDDLEKGTNDPRHWSGRPGTYTEQMEGPSMKPKSDSVFLRNQTVICISDMLKVFA